jgi:glycosyltransferase involved in cell wall biosynthesis
VTKTATDSRGSATGVIGVLPGLGGSLGDLARTGQVDRVLEHYLPAYLDRFARVRWFSYEPETLAAFTDDRELRARVDVVAPARRGGRRVTAVELGVGHRRRLLRDCGVVRALHAPGAVPAMLAGARYVCTYGYSYAATTQVSVPRRIAPAARAVKRPLLTAGLRIVLRRAAATIVTAHAVEAEARRLGARRIWLVPNGVDLDRFAPRAVAPEHDVVFVGRLDALKDAHTLVRAAGSVSPPPRLALVGEGPLRAELEDACRAAGVPAAFLGTLPNREVADVLARARCFVLPSRTEGHPKALLEAMATGLPCLGSDIPAIRELARDGAVALFPPGDARAAAALIRRVLDDPGYASDLGTRGGALVRERFDLRALLAREASALAALAEGRPAPLE